MARIFWSDKELESLIKTLKKHNTLNEALSEHNKSWKTGRTPPSVDNVLQSKGTTYGTYLGSEVKREEPKAIEDGCGKEIETLIKFCKKGATITDLCNKLDMSPKRLESLMELAKSKGYKLTSPDNKFVHIDMGQANTTRHVVHQLKIKPIKNRFSFGACADLHWGSKEQKPDEFKDYVQTCYDNGVNHIFAAGDILAGQNMYRSQKYEVLCYSGEDQAKMAAECMPRKKGLTYHIIGGNHDFSFLSDSGLDALDRLSSLRDDIKYYGMYNALIDINEIKVELHHPDKAGSYALSYHLQKEIESIPGGMKPHIAINGHTHQTLWMPMYRNVHAFYPGCFEGQTLYLKRKHVNPIIGGYILNVGITEDGALKSVLPDFISYFHGKRD